jgi:hypothetical protein
MPDTPVTNSYVATVETATAYLARLTFITEWTAATSAQKIAALQDATLSIDSQMLRGSKYEPKYIENGVQTDYDGDGLVQVLEFPRIIDGVVCDWDEATELPIVPQAVKDACCEEALAILTWKDSWRRKNQEQGLKSMTIDGVTESYRDSAGQGLLSARAKALLRPYMARRVSYG